MEYIILKCDRDQLYIVGQQSHDHTYKAVAECFTHAIAEALVRSLEVAPPVRPRLAPVEARRAGDDLDLLLGSGR